MPPAGPAGSLGGSTAPSAHLTAIFGYDRSYQITAGARQRCNATLRAFVEREFGSSLEKVVLSVSPRASVCLPRLLAVELMISRGQ